MLKRSLRWGRYLGRQRYSAEPQPRIADTERRDSDSHLGARRRCGISWSRQQEGRARGHPRHSITQHDGMRRERGPRRGHCLGWHGRTQARVERPANQWKRHALEQVALGSEACEARLAKQLAKNSRYRLLDAAVVIFARWRYGSAWSSVGAGNRTTGYIWHPQRRIDIVLHAQ
jgi:hypothetical protein